MIAIYLIAGVVLSPFVPFFVDMQRPALLSLVALFMLATWGLSYLSFRWDVLRIPVLGASIALLVIARAVLPSGHVYPLEERGALTFPDSFDVLDAFARRNDGTVVIVAASGGGIAVSLWTAVTLRGIGDRLGASFPFHRQVALVSSVSGGSVGGIYYVDAFGSQEGLRMDKVVEASGTPSLAAATWGIAYLDSPRLRLGGLMVRFDRAWA